MGNGSVRDEDLLGKAEMVRPHHDFPGCDASDPTHFALLSSENGPYLEHADFAHNYRHLLPGVRDLGGCNSLP